MSRRRTALAAVALTVTALAACAAEPERDAAPAGSSTSGPSATRTSSASPGSGAASTSPGTASATSDPAAASSSADASASPQPSEAPFVADTNPDSAQPSADAALVLTAIRSGTQPGFDRVVLELTGPGTPGWQAQYADAASRQGTGEAITPGGSAILDITVSGSAIPKEGQATVPAGQISTPGASVIKGVYNDGTFEGITHVVIGVDGKKPFRVFFVAAPPRVVIDVQH